MGKLAEWCKEQPAWVADALRRAALADEVSQGDVDALVARVSEAQGLPIEGDHPCEAFLDEILRPTNAVHDDVLLCSIGPLNGVDRLANDQQLKFALDGVTLIFGDNASGKSGYARAARQLCHARIASELRGDVYLDKGKRTPITVEYCHKQRSAADTTSETWKEGEPRPQALSGITVLDTENARVYVEGENEILFLPPEVTCLTRLGKLYTSAAAVFQAEVDALTVANAGPFGALYNEATTAGVLVRKLTTQTAKAALPTEKQLRDAANWDEKLEEERRDVAAKLAEAPEVLEARFNRLATSLEGAATSIDNALVQLDDAALNKLNKLIEERHRTRGVADALAAEQIGTQPIRGTGNEEWKQLYRYAREFAANVGIRPVEQPFEIGDPCPVCQRPLDEESTKRLAAFDAFVEGKASEDARVAANAIDECIKQLSGLAFKSDVELRQTLAEYGSNGSEAQQLVEAAVEFNRHAAGRRDRFVEALKRGELLKLDQLPASPVLHLKEAAANFRNEAHELAEKGKLDPAVGNRAAELNDQRQLHDQLAEVLERRNALERRLKMSECVGALSTLPVSRLATAVRKELVTPELSRRITEELEMLGLTHIPLKFGEKTEKGTSFFEVALASDQRAEKEEVLSEGEQRALSIACFLAESHVAGRKAGIIFDDPVTSLDHKRLRKVAERLAREAKSGRQIIVFTHNMLFYQEVLRACSDANPQVPVHPCVVRQYSEGKFGLVTNGDQPWIAKKVKEREKHLEEMLNAMPDGLPSDSEEFRLRAKTFYTDLRESWERAVEEVLLNAVVERFGTDVRTQSLKAVEVTDEDYSIIFQGMKRASEYSGHDRAAARQLDAPSKEQMRKDLLELVGFRSTRQKRRAGLEESRKKLEGVPVAQTA